MAHKTTLTAITILIALAAMQLWGSRPAVSQEAAHSVQQDPPTLTFDRPLINVVEPDAGEVIIITLYVRISKAPEEGEEAKVTYKSVNGNAIAGEDYVPVADDLIFPAGSTDAQAFEVAIIGNNINQVDRAFVVYLTNPTNATVGIPGAITVTILDNDPIPTPKEQNFMPHIRGHAAGPTITPFPSTPTVTPCSPYPTLR
jgi:hypothetical protein